MIWSEGLIAAAISRRYLNRQHLVVVPNCNWTGNECDLLCVTKDLRIIDFEIKISRSDFFADAKKSKWWSAHVNKDGHPLKVWKHYFVMPAEIWTDDMIDRLPSTSCGVLLLIKSTKGEVLMSCKQKAKPAKVAYRLSDKDVIDIARLASLRMWSMVERQSSGISG